MSEDYRPGTKAVLKHIQERIDILQPNVAWLAKLSTEVAKRDYMRMKARLDGLVAGVAEIKEALEKANRPPARSEELRELFLSLRNIEEPCEKCGGAGVYSYANTTTFHHGAGGQAITSDVCDRCWGSGDELKNWPSHKEQNP